MRQEAPLRNNLRQTRTRLGLSQQELARLAGVTRQAISGIEAGQYAPSATVALRLARALGCRVEELFWLEEDVPEVEAVPADGFSGTGAQRLALAQVGGRWVAHPLTGYDGFRTELIPADGVGLWADEPEEVAPDERSRAAGLDEPNSAEGPDGLGEADRRQPPRLRVRLLDAPENLLRTAVVAGCTPALSLWARAAERWHPGLRVHWIFANSTDGLQRLARGEVHAAGVHLYDPRTKEHNVPFVRRLLPNRSVVLVNLGVWEEGLAVAPGNPLNLRNAADLARPGLTIVNREPGAGSRQLLDRALQEAGVNCESVQGYGRTCGSHLEVARAVLEGRADAGVTAASVAAAFGLDFVPLHRVRYDIAVRKEYLEEPPVQQLLATLGHRWVRSQLEALGGYDTTHTGEVVATLEPDV